MSSPDAVPLENQIAFAFMSESDVREPRAALATDDTFGTGLTERGLLPILAGAVAAGAVVLALVASNAVAPLLLAVMGILAMLGGFLIFGLAAGHIRIGERVREEDLVKSLADGLDEAILVTTTDGTPVYANTIMRRLAKSREARGVSGLDALFGSDPKAEAAYFRLMRAASRGEAWREELEVRRPGDTTVQRWRVSARACTVKGHERKFGSLRVWTITDVTAERTAQAHEVSSLTAQLERLDSAPAGLMEVDTRGYVRRLNSTFLRWLGIEASRLTTGGGLKLADLISVQDLEMLLSATLQVHANNAGLDVAMRTDQGPVVTLKLFARRDAAGSLLVAAYPRDVSDAVDGIAGAADLRFARFFQSAPFGIATLDASGRLVNSNVAFGRLIPDGASAHGLSITTLLARTADAETQRAIDAAVAAVLTGTATPTPIELSFGQHKDTSRRLFLAPLSEKSSTREVATLYVIDATEQKALEAKFAQSSKMEAVGKLAGGIAHDFNNVLTAIIGFSDLLLQTHRPTDPAYKDIKNIQSSANRAAALVAQLLAFSRRQTQHTEALQLGDVLTDLGPLMKRSIGETIELKVSAGRDLWYVKADRSQLDRVILNLAFNARDAMPDGGALTIRTRNVSERECQKLTYRGMPVAEYVLIEVEDTGQGIPADVMPKIFEPFFTTKGVGKGTGLGLATVYGIVKQSGGFVYVDSTVGAGTTFRIYLPRYMPENDDEIVAQKTPKKDRPEDLTGSGRVLLVEDEDVVRSFAVRALKRQGYEVLEASSGVEALEVMAENEDRVDIVVSDVVMPEMDGPTLLKQLRKKNPKLKIIFVSGYPNEAFDASLDRSQHFAFLPKPFSLPQLAAKVKEELARVD